MERGPEQMERETETNCKRNELKKWKEVLKMIEMEYATSGKCNKLEMNHFGAEVIIKSFKQLD